MSCSLGQAENRLSDLSQYSVKQRLASLLLYLKTAFGINDCRGVKLDIHLNREEMASIAGTTPETVIRTLSSFKKERLIEENSKVIHILHHRY